MICCSQLTHSQSYTQPVNIFRQQLQQTTPQIWQMLLLLLLLLLMPMPTMQKKEQR